MTRVGPGVSGWHAAVAATERDRSFNPPDRRPAQRGRDTMNATVKILRNEQNQPSGKLADAELHFSGGELDGLKLIGFAVWSRQDGKRLVTFPARQFTVDGERRSFSLLRAVENPSAQERLRDFVMRAYLAEVQEIEGVATS